MAGNASCEPVKVVFINTQYVETDAMSFKSVVQSLTGKNSRAAYWMEKSSFVGQKRKTCGGNSGCHGGGGGGGGGVPREDLSSVDFERWLSELPPILEELNWFLPQ
ncbi:VQ motif-containing protein 10-like [Cornus florida]|uniref:VQ motif-containing protein 10-like n=1 Tax=Cornus florida TaxID=4283 RepID=UPI00289F6191|nr:VQ motif-containing protein 10-like [Cornus florida]